MSVGSARMAASAETASPSGSASAAAGGSSPSIPDWRRSVSAGMPNARATWEITRMEGWCRPRSSWLR